MNKPHKYDKNRQPLTKDLRFHIFACGILFVHFFNKLFENSPDFLGLLFGRDAKLMCLVMLLSVMFIVSRAGTRLVDISRAKNPERLMKAIDDLIDREEI